jgi:hypothetical protein
MNRPAAGLLCDRHPSVGCSAWLWRSVEGFSSGRRSSMVTILIALLVLQFFWWMYRGDLDHTAEAWQRFADLTGLERKTVNPLLGGSTFVSGTFGGRPVELYSRNYGKGQVQATRLRVSVANTGRATMKLRGPFEAKEAAVDSVTDDLFAACDSFAAGGDVQFYASSSPPLLVVQLQRNRGLWRELTALEQLCTIELHGPELVFEQLGVIHDVSYLVAVLDVLAGIAAEIDGEPGPSRSRGPSGPGRPGGK